MFYSQLAENEISSRLCHFNCDKLLKTMIKVSYHSVGYIRRCYYNFLTHRSLQFTTTVWLTFLTSTLEIQNVMSTALTFSDVPKLHVAIFSYFNALSMV